MTALALSACAQALAPAGAAAMTAEPVNVATCGLAGGIWKPAGAWGTEGCYVSDGNGGQLKLNEVSLATPNTPDTRPCSICGVRAPQQYGPGGAGSGREKGPKGGSKAGGAGEVKAPPKDTRKGKKDDKPKGKSKKDEKKGKKKGDPELEPALEDHPPLEPALEDHPPLEPALVDHPDLEPALVKKGTIKECLALQGEMRKIGGLPLSCGADSPQDLIEPGDTGSCSMTEISSRLQIWGEDLVFWKSEIQEEQAEGPKANKGRIAKMKGKVDELRSKSATLRQLRAHFIDMQCLGAQPDRPGIRPDWEQKQRANGEPESN